MEAQCEWRCPWHCVTPHSVIDDSDDDGKGKGKAVNGRKRIELTPPPELSEARKAELRAAMESVYQIWASSLSLT